MKELFDLFFAFAKIGATTFGGGYAMLPVLQREIVEDRKWATEEDLMDYYAIGQCTPGIIAVNVATFIGARRRGTIGAIFATAGVVFPSIVIIMIISAFIHNFAEYPAVQHALAGVRVCVCVLVFSAVIKLAKKSLIDAGTYAIFGAVLILSLFTGVQKFVWVIAAGIAGILIKVLSGKRSAESQGGPEK
ncbi:MAG: chromate transporter [Lachnospiraceae bacterium]|nr:chromate transporter [Lachnospiraceae bacterium]